MKKFIKFLLLVVIVAGLSSCNKNNGPYGMGGNGMYHVDQNDPYGEYSFQPISYDVGQALCWIPGAWDMGANTRVSDNWNQRCSLRLVITSNTTGYINGVLTNTSTGTIYYSVEKPGLLTSFDTKEHFYNVPKKGIQTASFIAHKYGDKTGFVFEGAIKFFSNYGTVDFSAFNGLYTSQSQSVSKDGLVYNVLHFTKQMSGQGTVGDQPFDIEFDYR